MSGDLAQEITNFIDKYIIFNKAFNRKAVMFLGAAHLACFDWAQLLMILAPETGCAKSRLAKMIRWLSPNPRDTAAPSPAWAYGEIDKGIKNGYVPTEFMDEIGKFFCGPPSKEISLMTAVICAGVDRDGGSVGRATIVNNRRDTENLSTFCPKVLVGIQNDTQGFFPDDMLRRAQIIRMSRKTSDEKVERFIPRQAKREAQALKERLELLADERRELAKECQPSLPEEIEDTLFDKTEPLVITGRMFDLISVPDVSAVPPVPPVSGRWEKSVIDDALAELKAPEKSAISEGIQLLRDCVGLIEGQETYGFFGNTLCPTTESEHFSWGLYSEIVKLPDAKWSTYNWGNKPLTQKQFWHMLKERGIRRPGADGSTRMSFEDTITKEMKSATIKAIDLSSFVDASKRYCPDITPINKAGTDGTDETRGTDRGVSTSLSMPLSMTRSDAIWEEWVMPSKTTSTGTFQ
jgi:Protein of unknown function (DUF3631)